MSLFKETGVYWVPEIPEGWEMRRAWQLFSERKTLGASDSPALVPSRHFGVVTQEEYSQLANRKPVDNPRTKHMMTEVKPGDFIISMGSFESGIEYSQTAGKVSNHYKVLIPQAEVLNGYFRWLFKSQPLINGIAGLAVEIRVGQEIHYSKFAKLSLPLPPLETQQRIADYLDRETAEIDAAVADLDRYVELLEKRRLLVVDEVLHSNGVTVSEWSEMPLKLIIRERFVGDWGGDPGTADVDSVCVRVADFDRSNNTVNDHVPTIRSYSREKYEAKRLRNHDILVERSGGGAKTPVGSAILYMGGDEALCANFIEVVRLDNNQLPEYWVHVLRREYMGRNTMRFVKQTTGIQNLDPQGFYDQKFPVPSLDIQRALVTELNGMTAEIDTLITESTKLRELLLKRRSVLITDVVTGRKQV